MNWSKLTSFFAIVLFFGLVSLISSETVVHKPGVNDEECVLCEFIMDELEKYIGSNATEEEIMMALEKVCFMLPTTVQDECKILVEDYAKEIVDLLVNGFSPSEICTAIKLCSSSNSRKSITFPGPQCVLCKLIMGKLTGMLSSNATEAEIESALKKVCSLLPSPVKAECDESVDKYTAMIIHLLAEKVAPEAICSLIGLCSTNKVPSQLMKPPQVDEDNCVLCEFIMNEVDTMLSQNSTKAEIEAVLEKVCSLLLSTIRSECNDFIEQYTPVLVSFLTEYSPEEVCTLLKFCASVHKQDLAKPKPAPPQVTDEYCVLCKLVMDKVDSLLSDNATDAEIEAALEKVCSLLPLAIRSECDDFINKYIPTLLELLVQDFPPEEICTLLKFCTTKSVHKQEVAKPKSTQIGDDICVLCEYIMKEVDSLLTENATEDEIVKVVENICTFLPGTLTEQCTSFLNTYGAALIVLLVQQLDPKEVCTVIKACPNTNKISAFESSGGFVKTNPQLCPFCEMIMAQLEDLLSENSTEEDIKKALDKVCSLIPGKFSTDCLLLVNRYSNAIIKLLLQEFDPSQICTALGFCTTTIAASEDKCTMCQLLVKFADDFLEKNNTVEEMVDALLYLCNILPSEFKNQCIDFVNLYGTMLPELIAELLDPLTVCQELDFCSQRKLGASLCSRGPATWCASMENAKLCNAVTHCKRHVWN